MRKYLVILIVVILVLPVLFELLKRGAPRQFSLALAMEEIKNMPIEQCRGALYLNQKFYQETANLSESESRAYFEVFRKKTIETGLPAPRLPPPHGGAIDIGLNRRCGESANKAMMN